MQLREESCCSHLCWQVLRSFVCTSQLRQPNFHLSADFRIVFPPLCCRPPPDILQDRKKKRRKWKKKKKIKSHPNHRISPLLCNHLHQLPRRVLQQSQRERCLNQAKRGRGAIGSRMDEPGPYPLSKPVNHDGNEQQAGPDSREKEEWEHRVVGPPKPSFIKSSHESSSEEEHYADSSKKKHRSTQKKRISKEGRSERKKTKEKKKSKHIRHHKSRRRRDNE